jgi:hypothetical protein
MRTPTRGGELRQRGRADDDHHGHGQGGQAGFERGEAQHDLEVEGEEEKPAQEGCAREGSGDERATAHLVGQDPQREQRVIGTALDEDEEREQHDTQRDEDEHLPSGPTVLRLGEAEDQGAEAEGHEDGAGHVVPGVAVGLALLDHRNGGNDGNDGDRHVHEQAPAPAGVLGEHAAEHQADRSATTGDRTVDREGLDAVLAAREVHGEQRQRRGCEEGGEQALQAAGGEELPGALCHAAEGGSNGEARHAHDEGALPAPIIGDATTEKQERTEDQRVKGDDPGAVAVAHAEVGLGMRERDVDNSAVEHDGELGEGDDGQQPPPTGVVAFCGGKRCI